MLRASCLATARFAEIREGECVVGHKVIALDACRKGVAHASEFRAAYASHACGGPPPRNAGAASCTLAKQRQACGPPADAPSPPFSWMSSIRKGGAAIHRFF
jgi:hypothetical protein